MYDDIAMKELKNVYPDKDVEVVASFDEGGGWGWDVAYVYRVYGPDVYYLGSDSGCSCDFYCPTYGELIQFSSRRSLLNYLRKSDILKYRDLHKQLLNSR